MDGYTSGYNYKELLTKLGDSAHRYPVLVQEARKKPYTDKQMIHKFYAFPSWSSYRRYEQSLPASERNYFETIRGEQPQKPKFDLDLDKNKHKFITFQPEQLLDALVYAIIHVLAQLGVQLRLDRDLLLFESHCPEKGKWSYHLIIDNWLHRNHYEAQAFYERVIAEVPAEYRVEPYIDPKVYSAFQQFRLLGNCKHGTGRYKKFAKNWRYNGNGIVNLLDDSDQIFMHSLVTNTDHCHHLPPMEKQNRTTHEVPMGELPAELGPIIDLVPPTYQYQKTVKCFLIFVRKELGREAYCDICERSHTNDNAFVLITNGEILFFCRRNEYNRPKVLGYVEKKKKPSLRCHLIELDQERRTKVLSRKQRLHDSVDRLLTTKR